MKNYSAEEFAKLVMEHEGDFKPSAYYDPHGDCIEFIASEDSFYAQRLDDLVTVYLSNETNEIVGSMVKGIKKLLRNGKNIKVLIDDGKIKLNHLLVFHLQNSTSQTSESRTYKKLIDLAESNEVSAELLEIA